MATLDEIMREYDNELNKLRAESYSKSREANYLKRIDAILRSNLKPENKIAKIEKLISSFFGS